MYYKTKQGQAVTWYTEGSEKISKREYSQLQSKETCEYLRELLGSEPYIKVTVTRVTARGRCRHMLVETIVGSRIIDISSYVATALEWPEAEFYRVRVSGCGMDMTLHLRESLSMQLYGDFKKIKGD
jgi:hypothetical protein